MSRPRSTTDEPRAQSVREQVLEQSRAYVLSRAIHVAAELGVADHVSDTPVPVRELARLTATHPAYLERLLRFLAGHGIFAEVTPGEFIATPASDVFRDDAPSSLRPGLRMVNAAWWAAVGGIGHAVRTGEATFSSLHGETFFSYLKNHADDQRRFDAGMAANSRSSDDAIARAYDFSRAPVVLDIGGGRGGLIASIVEHHPSVKGILFDQPQVVERSILPVGERYARIGGDFFEGVPASADLYVVKGVLHDFDDEKASIILKNCRHVMSPQSRLLIVERMISPDNTPHQAKTIDLLMMALLGGRERSIPEWEALLRSANLALVQRYPTTSEFTIFECAPV